MSFLDKIDAFCEERNISSTRFEREAGIGKGLISKWRRKGLLPTYRSQMKAAALMGITPEDLMREDPSDFSIGPVPDNWTHEPDIVRDATIRYVPVFSYENLKFNDEDRSGIITHLAFLPETLESAGECFGMVIEDSSMAPDLQPGDIAIVHIDEAPDSGDIVIVVTPGEKTLCRRLIISGNNYILQPFSKHYAPVVYSREELDFLPVIFKGKVIAAYRHMMSSSYSIPE